MTLEYQIVTAVGLDLVIGDPRWLPHPVKLIGRLALWLEDRCRALVEGEIFAGAVTTIGVILTSSLGSAAVLWAGARVGHITYEVVSILMLFTTLAAKDLMKHSKAVYKALKCGDLELARKRAGMMVGRSTEDLDGSELVRATVESVAENMVDGVIAPLFYALLFGPVGAITYKAVNTLDSTFGYKNERYSKFGKFPARLDDVANYVPARIGALLVPIVARLIGLRSENSWKILRRDARCHDSPNAGWPEAAFAGALGIRLGGRNTYGDKVSIKPYLGEPLEPFEANHIMKANRLMICSSLLILVGGVIVRSLIS